MIAAYARRERYGGCESSVNRYEARSWGPWPASEEKANRRRARSGQWALAERRSVIPRQNALDDCGPSSGTMVSSCDYIGMHWDYIAILLFLGVIAPTLGYFRVRRLLQIPSTTSMERLTLYASTIAFQWLIVAAIVWRTAVYGVNSGQLGLAMRDGELTASVAIVLSLLMLANQMFSIRKLAANPQEMKGMIVEMALKIFPQGAIERLAFVALVITVAICEEFIYRGFIQGLFQSVGGSVAAGIVGSALFFGGAHVYQGRRGLISTFVVGVLFATVRWWTGNLLPAVCAHFVADLAAGLYAPGKLRAAIESRASGPGTAA